MSKDKYLDTCELMQVEPNIDRMPPGLEDFPTDVQKALVTFNKLGDRIYPDIGYLGKDYTSLPLHIQVLELDNLDLFLETLLQLDAKLIKSSAQALKTEREKIKATK